MIRPGIGRTARHAEVVYGEFKVSASEPEALCLGTERMPRLTTECLAGIIQVLLGLSGEAFAMNTADSVWEMPFR